VSIYRLSERAVTMSWPAEISREINTQVLKTDRLIREKPFRGWLENVPAYHTLTVYYDPVLLEISLHDHLLELARIPAIEVQANKKLVEIPVFYDANKIADLKDAASILNLTVEELIKLHSSTTYHVFMLGFMPGFPYMGVLPDPLIIPRKTIPAKKVAAGTVAIAGKQTGIYPFDSPGGWYGIGWTPMKMFDNGLSFLEPGDEVKFIPQWA
jgi:inhibitor of KinA